MMTKNIFDILNFRLKSPHLLPKKYDVYGNTRQIKIKTFIGVLYHLLTFYTKYPSVRLEI